MNVCQKALRAALATTALGALFALAAPAAAKDCSELGGLKLENGKVTSAELVAAGAFKAPPSPFAAPGVKGSPFDNLPAFCQAIPQLVEASIGHAITADALRIGFPAAVEAYLRALKRVGLQADQSTQ